MLEIYQKISEGLNSPWAESRKFSSYLWASRD